MQERGEARDALGALLPHSAPPSPSVGCQVLGQQLLPLLQCPRAGGGF